MVATDVASRGIGMVASPPPPPSLVATSSRVISAVLYFSCIGALFIARICLISHCVSWFSSIQEFWGPWCSGSAIPIFRLSTLFSPWYKCGVGNDFIKLSPDSQIRGPRPDHWIFLQTGMLMQQTAPFSKEKARKICLGSVRPSLGLVT